MVKRDELTKFVNKVIGKDLLENAKRVDTLPNGVQVHGKDEVKKVVLGVSTSVEFFKEALKAKADYCIFHHGMNIQAYAVNSRLDTYEERLRLIFKNDLTVAGYHCTLDAHPEIGNNAMIIKLLGAKRLNEPFFEEWGWVGEFSSPQDPRKLADKCAEVFSHDVFSVFAGDKKIKRIGVCSGGAKPRGGSIFEILDKKIDCFISGEIIESGPDIAKELGYHYFAGGHYATEVFGVQELGKKIKEHFKDKLEVEFIDIPSSL